MTIHRLSARRITAVLLATVVIMAWLTIAGAPAAVAADGAITFSVSWPLIIGLLVSTVLPLLVGLVTRTNTSSGVKAVILAALAAVTGLLSELGTALTNQTPYDLGVGLLTALGAFLVATGLHFGLFKPTGASTALQEVGSKPTF